MKLDRQTAARGLRILGLLALLAFLTVRPAAAQNLFRPAPRPLKIALTRAREAISEERYSDAVSQLGAILTADSLSDAPDSVGQDFFYDTEGDASARRSIKTLAELWLGELPRSARQLFELKYGGVARATAEQAIEKRDYQLLNEVTRKYFYTPAGHEACMLLARRHLDEGRPFASATLFERVARSPDRAAYEPQASLLAAMSWRLAGLNERAEKVLRDLKQNYGDNVVDLGPISVPIFAEGEAPLKWLEKHFGVAQQIRQNDVTQWAMHRGGADRNASAAGGMPLVNYRWRTPTSYDPDDERLLRDIQRQNEVLGAPTIPSVSPLAIGETVLMRSARRLVAVDYQSGKRIWEFPWDDSPDDEAKAAMRRQPSGNGTLRYAELQERILQDATYGQLAAHNGNVFMISELSFAESSAPSVQIQLGGIRSTNRTAGAFNQLVALNLKRQGAIHWIVGGEDGWDEPELAECFFLGAPLPIDGRLYVLLEQRGEIQLGVLEADSGQLLWRQQLARVDEIDITMDGKRRLAGATPTYADGVLICPTSAGAVVAIDLATRALRWGRQYKTPPRSSPSSFRRNATTLPQQGERWLDASVTVAEGKVLLTPIESDVLICLDLFDGSRVWSTPRNKMIYVACIYRSQAVLVGVDQVLALDLESGGSSWKEPIQLGGSMPSGRGFRSGDRYFLPTTQNEILEIDLAKGAIVRRVKANEPLGNLIAYRGGIISQGVEWLAAYHQLSPLAKEIEQRLKQDPNDAWALARKCELLLQQGRREEALATLRKTAELAPDNPRIRRLTITTLLEALESDFPANRDSEARLRKLITTPENQARLLRALAIGFQEHDQPAKAVEVLVELAELPRDILADYGIEESPLESISPVHQVRPERWVQSRLAELLEQDAAREKLDDLLPPRLEKAIASGNVALNQFIQRYGPHATANTARLKLADSWVQQGRYLAAELLLAEVLRTGSEAQLALAEGALAGLVESSGRLGDAAAQFRRIRDRFPDQVVDAEGRTGKQAYEAALKRDPKLAHFTERNFPLGRVDLKTEEVSAQVLQPYHRVYPFRMLSGGGPSFQGLRVELDQNRAIIRVSDGAGRQLQLVNLKERPRMFSNTSITLQGRTFGHLAVVSVGANVYAVDTLSSPNETGGPVMWSENLSYPLGQPTSSSNNITARASANQWGVHRGYAVDQNGQRVGSIGPITSSGVSMMRLRELVCVDPISGQTIWSRTSCPPGGELSGDAEHVVLLEPERPVAVLYSARDGRFLGERKAAPAPLRLATHGVNLLWWEDVKKADGDSYRMLRLTNLVSQEHLFEQRFENGSLGRVLDGEEFLTLQPDGKLQVISLADGQTIMKSDLSPQTQMQQLLVMGDADAYYVGVSHSASAPDNVTVTSAPPAAPPMNGRLYAVGRDGMLRWTRPAELSLFFLPENQPSLSPVIVLMRGIRDRRQNSSANQTSLLVLDRRDGRVLLFEKQATPNIGRYRVVVGDKGEHVDVLLHKKRFRLLLTDEPPPPAPVAYVKDPVEQPSDGNNPPRPNPNNPFGGDPFR